MEIFFIILAGIFSILASVFGVKNRIIGNTKPGTGSDLRNGRSGYNDLVSNYQRLERDKDRISELDKRDDENIERCRDISSRIRRREQETTAQE